jgi:CDP-diacylglycerol---glycerol-3-phosphate 3-phosphatidyltransferase
MSWTGAFGRGCRVLLSAIVRRMAIARISPNVLTFLGLVIDLIAACFFGYASGANQRAMFFYAGLVVFAAGFMDLVDGRVARASNRVTRFGGFFDSVVDRYSDVAIFFGLLVYYARVNRFFYVVLVAVVMTGSVMVSYTRARAESLIGSCRVGFMERPERLVLVIIGAVFNRMAPVLWVLAVFSNITVIHRIYYTWQKTKPAESAPAENISAA